MQHMMKYTDQNCAPVSIHELPEELLAYILSLLTPYNNYKSCKLVCKRWYHLIKDLEKHLKQEFFLALKNGRLHWKLHSVPVSYSTTITKRYCHYNNMYVFGGFTSSNTTFNDLWRLDLTTREWKRPLTTGTYPPPKASASLVAYKNKLFLFGGVSYRYMTGSVDQLVSVLYRSVHVYDIKSNTWDELEIHYPERAPHLAGHSASILQGQMIVFGGFQLLHQGVHILQSSNSVWALDLNTLIWKECLTSEPRPHPRYAHTQVKLSDDCIVIIGGHGGPNAIFNDVWLLELNSTLWRWTELQVSNVHWAPQHIWRHPGCKIDNLVVFLGKYPTCKGPHTAGFIPWTLFRRPLPVIWTPPVDKRERWEQGHFKSSGNAGPRNMAPWPSIRPNASKNRALQLEGLQRAEQRLQCLQKQNLMSHLATTSHATMDVYVLDISGARSQGVAKWERCKQLSSGSVPEETSFYSLVEGQAELVMFGGLQRSLPEGRMDALSNAVHFLRAPHFTP